jgi:hypothetical protein
MIRSKRRLGVALGLCLMALGLVGASPAHATMHWNVGGAQLAASTAVVGALDETGILHTKIGGNAVLFECASGKLVGVSLELVGAVKGGDIKFEGCITKINGVTNKACEPNDSGTNPGVILTNPLDGLIVLHELAGGAKDDIVLLESLIKETVGGVAGEPVFARIKMSAECPIGTNVPVIGPHATLIDVTNGITNGSEILKEQLTHLFEVGPLTELWTLSLTEEHKATILGKSKVNLVSDQNWSGTPD